MKRTIRAALRRLVSSGIRALRWMSPRRRLLRLAVIGLLVLVAAGAGLFAATRRSTTESSGPIVLPPTVITSPRELPAVVVVGASRKWYLASNSPLRYGDPVPVVLTAYCLSGTTRRGRYVRSGIVAADPKYFPLSRYIEVYVGDQYLGRFLVDDTGSGIRGARLDVWMPTCRQARIFGRVRGTAVLVPRPEASVRQAGAERR
jgi:3D (Asp-Asp-Asp) domain-containing protein